MAVMYLANCTKYYQEFNYRIPGSSSQQLHELKIGPMGQEKLPHELGEMELRIIAEAHQKYGLVEDKDVPNVKGYNGMIFRIGKKIDMERMEHVLETTLDHLEEQVTERFKSGLAASDNRVKSIAGEENATMGQIEVLEVTDSTRTGTRKGAVMAGRNEKRRAG